MRPRAWYSAAWESNDRPPSSFILHPFPSLLHPSSLLGCVKRAESPTSSAIGSLSQVKQDGVPPQRQRVRGMFLSKKVAPRPARSTPVASICAVQRHAWGGSLYRAISIPTHPSRRSLDTGSILFEPAWLAAVDRGPAVDV
jgi:hypothetical protein